VQAAYACLGPRINPAARTQELDDSVMVDYDADGKVIGVELLDVALPVIASPDPLT
jgi:uncharacterized protein YuzE